MKKKVVIGIIISIIIIIAMPQVNYAQTNENINIVGAGLDLPENEQIIDGANEEEKIPNTTLGEEEKTGEYITEDDLIYSTKYLVKGKVIYKIEPKTSIEEFKENVEIAKGQEIKIYKGEKEITSGYIGTGMKIKGEGEEYTTCVRGDITGDGISNQIELTRIIRHIVGLNGWKLEGIEKEAGDISRRWRNKPSRCK